jgi:hypothetical protein
VILTELADTRIPYGLRRIPREAFANLLSRPERPQIGDVALVEVESIGRNTALELSNGRRCSLHEGDRLFAVFGNRYATMQFEGYAEVQGEHCDLLSMGGLCGVVKSRHVGVAGPTRLRVLGAIGDQDGQPLRSVNYALPPLEVQGKVPITVVCGSSMDAGKTYTVGCMIKWFRDEGYRVAGIKLTGTAAGRDTWNMLDAGACVALDLTDGGLPSTYLCPLERLLDLHRLLIGHAMARGAQRVVVEIADGLLQGETAALLQSPRFTSTVNEFIFAAGEPMAALAGVCLLRSWGIEPLAVSGVVSMSSLNVREVEAATRLRCLTSAELENGELSELLAGRAGSVVTPRAMA